jgi:hypothetical protein
MVKRMRRAHGRVCVRDCEFVYHFLCDWQREIPIMVFRSYGARYSGPARARHRVTRLVIGRDCGLVYENA